MINHVGSDSRDADRHMQEQLQLLIPKKESQRAVRSTRKAVKHGEQWVERRTGLHVKGKSMVALSAFAYSIVATLVKFSADDIPFMEAVFWRSLVAYVLTLFSLCISRTSLKVPKGVRYSLAARCVMGFCSMSLSYYSMQEMVLTDASVLLFTSPIMSFFMSTVTSSTKFTGLGAFGGLCGVVAVICVARPDLLFGEDPSEEEKDASKMALIVALLGAGSKALASLRLKRLKNVHFLVIIHYFLLTCSIASGIAVAAIQQKFMVDFNLATWSAAFGTGFLGFLAQLFLARGYEAEDPETASLVRYIEVGFVLLWDKTLLAEDVNIWSVVGGIADCAGAATVAASERRKKRFRFRLPWARGG